MTTQTEAIETKNAQPESDREIVISRLFDAPRELIWKLWTTPEHIAKWWGPVDFTNTTYEMDVRPGGVWRYTMHGADGVDYADKVVYVEVVENERLEYSHSSEDDPDFKAFRTRVTFEEKGAQTEVTMRIRLESVEEKNRLMKFGAVEGGHSTLYCLAEYLKTLS